jgi:hypothetical protein
MPLSMQGLDVASLAKDPGNLADVLMDRYQNPSPEQLASLQAELARSGATSDYWRKYIAKEDPTGWGGLHQFWAGNDFPEAGADRNTEPVNFLRTVLGLRTSEEDHAARQRRLAFVKKLIGQNQSHGATREW